jgi:PKD repeat protein
MFDWAYITINVMPPDMPLDANSDASNFGGYEGIVGEEIQFYGAGIGGEPPYSYEWNFESGQNPVEGQNPTHTYNEAGTYTATLTVTDNEGNTATDTSIVVVADKDELVANAGGPYDGAKSEDIFFSGSASGGQSPYAYEWNFGDGSTASGQYVHHSYDTEGTYTATLTVTDNIGNVDEHTTTVIVNKGESTEIRDVKGGLGVKATIKAGDLPVDWTIDIDGKYVFGTTTISGTIDANGIETVKTPFAIGIGNVDITITASSLVEEYTAFMIGPFVIAVK